MFGYTVDVENDNYLISCGVGYGNDLLMKELSNAIYS